MCTRPTPSCHSVSASARALGIAVLATFHGILFLLVALASSPLRGLWHLLRPARSASLAHIEVQVHLGDAGCIAELEAIVWKTLARAERTWAPLPLPVDRVVVGSSFPASGRADVYDNFLTVAEGATAGGTPRQSQRRVVISLGVRDGTRDLDGWEVAGALATQIQALVDDRCRQHKSVGAPVPDERPVAASSRLARPAAVVEQSSTTAPALAKEGPAATVAVEAPRGQEVPSLAELLATVQQGQPLVAAGPPSNGTHP